MLCSYQKLLLCFDNIDSLAKNDDQNDKEYKDMLKFINEIATEKLKVLYTSANFHLNIFKD